MAKKRTVTKTSSAGGGRSRTVTKTKKDGSSVTKSRRVSKSPTGRSVTRNVTTRSPKKASGAFVEHTFSTTKKKAKVGGNKVKSVVKKNTSVVPVYGGGRMGTRSASENIVGESSQKSKVVTRKKGVGRSVNRTVSSSRSYDQLNFNDPRYINSRRR